MKLERKRATEEGYSAIQWCPLFKKAKDIKKITAESTGLILKKIYLIIASSLRFTSSQFTIFQKASRNLGRSFL